MWFIIITKTQCFLKLMVVFFQDYRILDNSVIKMVPMSKRKRGAGNVRTWCLRLKLQNIYVIIDLYQCTFYHVNMSSNAGLGSVGIWGHHFTWSSKPHEGLTISRSNYKGSTFSSVIFKTLSVRSGRWLSNLRPSACKSGTDQLSQPGSSTCIKKYSLNSSLAMWFLCRQYYFVINNNKSETSWLWG